MRTLVETTNVYKFDELTDKQQEKALEKFEVDYSFVIEDYVEGIKAFCKVFDLQFNYSLGYDRGTFVKISSDFKGKTFQFFADYGKGKKFWKLEKDGECTFTGTYVDGLFADVVLDNWNSDFSICLQDMGTRLNKSCSEECLYQLSDEAKKETIVCNNYEFDEEGNLV